MVKALRFIYLVGAVLFLLGVVAQVFLAGMVLMGQMGWDSHAGLGFNLGLALLLMLVTAYLGRLPRRMKGLTWLLFVVYILQLTVISSFRGSAPAIAALHPVLALVDFGLGALLVTRAGWLVRQAQDEASTVLEPAAETAG